jgi:hypothetical protein
MGCQCSATSLEAILDEPVGNAGAIAVLPGTHGGCVAAMHLIIKILIIITPIIKTYK